jgi:general secretion pathway protein K
MMTGGVAQRGMVLVTVLWTIALCSALAMATLVSFRSFAGIVTIDRDRVQADALLTGGLEMAAALATEWPGKPLLERKGAFNLSTGSVSVEISDEGGRIDIGKAPADFLAALLVSVGAPWPQANSVAQSIVRRRDGDDTPTNTTPANASAADQTMRSGNALFADVGQIAEIPGMHPNWVAAIRPLTTIFGAETVNPLTAPPGVIASIPGVDQTRLQAFLAARRISPNDADRLGAILGDGQRYVSPRPQQVAAVQIAAVMADGFTTAAHAVIVLMPQDRQPYRVLVWRPVSASAIR